jgi:hypothetical protein
MTKHPIISVYGRNTLQKDFPLILVVGREPNDDLPMGNAVGYYKFKKPVPFWDLAYSLISESIGKRGMELKSLCKERRSSPIAFADISSKPVLSGDKRKQRIRGTLASPDYEKHLQKVASKPIFQRVHLVIFSGLDYPIWAEKRYAKTVSLMKSEWENTGKEVSLVRFFYGQNMKAIKTAFSGNRAVAKRTVETWLNESPSSETEPTSEARLPNLLP